MKKFLLSLALVIGVGSAMSAESYTITFATGTNTQSTLDKQKVAEVISSGASYVSSFTNVTNSYGITAGGMRVGQNKKAGNVTINLNEAVNVTSLVFKACGGKNASAVPTMTVNGESQDLAKSANATPANSDWKEYTYNVTGSTSAITIATTYMVNIASITVNYGEGGGPTAPTAPQIKGESTFYGESTTVTMSAATGADIYYTMSTTGAPADPTTASLKYDGEIVINATTYFKAIAVKDSLSSTVTEATFTKGTAINVISIADFLDQNTGDVCTFTNPVTVVGLYNNRYLFVQDETGYLQIFDGSNGLDRPYQMGQTIKGFTLARAEYNKTPQGTASNFLATFPATADGTAHFIAPTKIEATAEAVNANINRYVYVTGSITKTGSNYFIDAVQLYDRFSLKLITDDLVGVNKDYAGFAVMFNTTPEIFYTKVGEPGTVSVDGIAVEESEIYGANGYVVAPQGAQVYNMAGMRVANEGLAAGIYLVRNGNKTVKVVVR